MIDYVVSTLTSALEDLKHMQRQVDILTRTVEHLDEQYDQEYERHTPVDGAFPYIPLNFGTFTQSLVELEDALALDKDYRHPEHPYRPISFLDAGCGTGRNLFVLLHGSQLRLGNVRGIEIGPTYVERAWRTFGLRKEVTQGDAMKFDQYHKFDVIYFYRPFRDDAMQTKFERRLIRMARPGAYLIGHLNQTFDRSKALKPISPCSRVFKKLKNVRKPAKGKRAK
jgi:SAM-dependent methyltransferase